MKISSLQKNQLKIVINFLKRLKINENVGLDQPSHGMRYLALKKGDKATIEKCIKTATEILIGGGISDLESAEILQEYVKYELSNAELSDFIQVTTAALYAPFVSSVVDSVADLEEEKYFDSVSDKKRVINNLYSFLADEKIRKLITRIESSLPDRNCSNPISALINFCKHQLLFDVDLKHEEQLNGSHTYWVKFQQEEIESFSHAKMRYAKEQASKKTLAKLADKRDVLQKYIDFAILSHCANEALAQYQEQNHAKSALILFCREVLNFDPIFSSEKMASGDFKVTVCFKGIKLEDCAFINSDKNICEINAASLALKKLKDGNFFIAYLRDMIQVENVSAISSSAGAEELQELLDAGIMLPENLTESQLANLGYSSIRDCIIARKISIEDVLALPQLTVGWLEGAEETISFAKDPLLLEWYNSPERPDVYDCADPVHWDQMLLYPVKYRLSSNVVRYLNQETIKNLRAASKTFECPFSKETIVFDDTIDLEKVVKILTYCVDVANKVKMIKSSENSPEKPEEYKEEKSVPVAGLLRNKNIFFGEASKSSSSEIRRTALVPDYQSKVLESYAERLIDKCSEAEKNGHSAISVISLGRCYNPADIVDVINMTKSERNQMGIGRGCYTMLSRGDSIGNLVSRLLVMLQSDHEKMDEFVKIRRDIMSATWNAPLREIMITDFIPALGWVSEALCQDFMGKNPSKIEFNNNYLKKYPLNQKNLMEMAFLCYCYYIQSAPAEAASFNCRKFFSAVDIYLKEEGIDLSFVDNQGLRNLLKRDFFQNMRNHINEQIAVLQGRTVDSHGLSDQAQVCNLLNLFVNFTAQKMAEKNLDTCKFILYVRDGDSYSLADQEQIFIPSVKQKKPDAYFSSDEYKKSLFGELPCIEGYFYDEYSILKDVKVLVCPALGGEDYSQKSKLSDDSRYMPRGEGLKHWVENQHRPVVSASHNMRAS